MQDSNLRILVGNKTSFASGTNDANLMSMIDDDRTEWDGAWSSMPHRRILDTTKVDFVKMSGLEVGEVVSVTIAEAPKEHFDKIFNSISVCPVCGRTTDDDPDRVEVGVYPVFTKISGLGLGSWAHRKCLESCPLIDEPTPCPW